MPGAASLWRRCAPNGRSAKRAAARISIVGMFCNFGALARLPLIEANAISFTSPLFSVALAAVVLKERVRLYRWSAVIVGFVGVLVVLSPHFSGDELAIALASTASVAGVGYALAGSVCNAGDHDSDPAADGERNDIVDRVLFFADLRAGAVL